MDTILIKNGTVWTGDTFLRADVLCENGIVSKIEAGLTDSADIVFDATDKIVSAGLVDIHVHLKGFASDEFGIPSEMCSFPFGVTAVNDAGSGYGDKTRLDSLTVKRVVFVYTGICDNHTILTETDAMIEKYGEYVRGIKVYFDTDNPDVRDITPLKEACAFARARGLQVMVHCSNSPVSMAEIIRTLNTGDIVTHLYHGGINGCCEDDYLAFKLAAEKGVILDAGFAGNVHTDFERLKYAVASGYLPDTIGSDITCRSAYKRGGRYGLTLCMSMARAAGMREEDIFRAVTATPAAVLGKGQEWGHLRIGAPADIAVLGFTNEPFDFTDAAGHRFSETKGYRCALTVLDGQIVFKD